MALVFWASEERMALPYDILRVFFSLIHMRMKPFDRSPLLLCIFKYSTEPNSQGWHRNFNLQESTVITVNTAIPTISLRFTFNRIAHSFTVWDWCVSLCIEHTISSSQLKMFQSVFIFFLAASIPWVACQSKSYRANIDILTDNYLRAEKTLWLRLTNDKEIRVNLLPEIYETHRNALTKDFGECGTVWELGIRMHENIITNILGINGTANNLQHALQNQQYDGAIAIAESAINKTVEAAKVLYQTTSQATFWSHISVNVRQFGSQVGNSQSFYTIFF